MHFQGCVGYSSQNVMSEDTDDCSTNGFRKSDNLLGGRINTRGQNVKKTNKK